MNDGSEVFWPRFSHFRARALLPVLGISLVLGGCAHWPSGLKAPVPDSAASVSDGQGSTVGDFDQAALDSLAEALSQIRTPQLTTLQTRASEQAHYRFLVNNLSERGYGIQRVSADQGAHFVALTRTPEVGIGDAGLVTYSLSVGAIELRRDFMAASEDRFRPMGALKVSGTRSSVTLDDSRFGLSNEVAQSVSRVEYAAMTEAMIAMPVISLITDDVVASATQTHGIVGKDHHLPVYPVHLAAKITESAA